MVINPIVGVYIRIIRIPIKGGMTIPSIRSFDCGTCSFQILHAEVPCKIIHIATSGSMFVLFVACYIVIHVIYCDITNQDSLA